MSSIHEPFDRPSGGGLRARRGDERGSPRNGHHRRGSHDAFRRFAYATSDKLGRPWAFVAALSLVIGWAATGPAFGFSETWQLVINTSTTIITFLMVFLIQASQNRDAKAIHLKLDELLRASQARSVFCDLEEADEEELEAREREFRMLRERAASERRETSRTSKRAAP